MKQPNRRSRRAALVATMAGALTLGVAAAAAGGHLHRNAEFPISLAEAQDRADARFREMDSDGNGEISAAEFAAAAPRLHRGHGPHRGHGRPGEERRAGEDDRDELDAALFRRLDTDADGQLSEAEFDGRRMREARSALLRERMFAHLDADGSGALGPEELPDPSRRLQAMDADGDGTVTREEARAHHRARHAAGRSEPN